MPLTLEAYQGPWEDDDPHANFKSEVAAYTLEDPLSTLETLSRETGIPVGALIRYVLVKWAASCSEALMAMSPIAFEQMRQHIVAAEVADTDDARLQAYHRLRQMVEWLMAGAR